MRLATKIAAGVAALALGVVGHGIASASTTGPDLYGNFRNFHSGKCLDVRTQDDALAPGARVQQYHCTGALEQQWAGHYVGHRNNGPFSDPRLYQFKVKRSGMCLQPVSLPDPVVDGLPLVQWPCDETNEFQKWFARYPPDGAQGWVNARTGKCIDVPDFSTADSVIIEQYQCNGSDAQLFHTKLETPNP